MLTICCRLSESGVPRLESVTAGRTFSSQQYEVGSGVTLTLYVYNKRAIIQLKCYPRNLLSEQNAVKVCMNINEFDHLLNTGMMCTGGFDRVGWKQFKSGPMVYRRDIKHRRIDIPSKCFRRLQNLRDILIANYNAAMIYIDNLNDRVREYDERVRDLLVACGVYYDSSIRQANCSGCRNRSNMDPFQNPHTCAFETTGHKQSRAKQALMMIDEGLVYSILASNGGQPLAYSVTDVRHTHRELLTRRIGAYHVTPHADKMIQVHKNINCYIH